VRRQSSSRRDVRQSHERSGLDRGGEDGSDRAVRESRAAQARATLLWGTRGDGQVIVAHVAQDFGVPLVDLRLTTIEPVGIRGAIYADDALGKTVWLPPEFLPGADQPRRILFLDALTAAGQRQELPRFEIPPWPRRVRAPSWRLPAQAPAVRVTPTPAQ
jgi:hypothetical protein